MRKNLRRTDKRRKKSKNWLRRRRLRKLLKIKRLLD
jgi:hypothetical protein